MVKRNILRVLVLALGAAALSAGLLRADDATTQPAGATPVTAWDGSTDAGKGWTSKADTVTITGDGEGHKGKKSVQVKGSGSGFVGWGWNWIGFFPPDAGTDASACDRVRFNIKLTGDAKPKDFNVHLSSNNKKASKDAQVSKYLTEANADLTDGNWHEVVVPLKDLANGDFDPKSAWELDMGEWSADNVNFTLLIDSIQFLPPDGK